MCVLGRMSLEMVEACLEAVMVGCVVVICPPYPPLE